MIFVLLGSLLAFFNCFVFFFQSTVSRPLWKKNRIKFPWSGLNWFPSVAITAELSIRQNWYNWFLGQRVQSADPFWISSYSADCREMHQTLIITANVRGSLAIGMHSLLKYLHVNTNHEHAETPNHHCQNATSQSSYPHTRLSTSQKVIFRVWALLSSFLISQNGPEFRLRQRKRWCSVLFFSYSTNMNDKSHAHIHTDSISQRWL